MMIKLNPADLHGGGPMMMMSITGSCFQEVLAGTAFIIQIQIYICTMPWQCHGIAMAMPCLALPLPWHCHAMAVPWHSAMAQMALPWHCHGNALALPWHCHHGIAHGIAMAMPWPSAEGAYQLAKC